MATIVSIVVVAPGIVVVVGGIVFVLVMVALAPLVEVAWEWTRIVGLDSSWVIGLVAMAVVTIVAFVVLVVVVFVSVLVICVVIVAWRIAGLLHFHVLDDLLDWGVGDSLVAVVETSTPVGRHGVVHEAAEFVRLYFQLSRCIGRLTGWSNRDARKQRRVRR